MGTYARRMSVFLVLLIAGALCFGCSSPTTAQSPMASTAPDNADTGRTAGPGTTIIITPNGAGQALTITCNGNPCVSKAPGPPLDGEFLGFLDSGGRFKVTKADDSQVDAISVTIDFANGSRLMGYKAIVQPVQREQLVWLLYANGQWEHWTAASGTRRQKHIRGELLANVIAMQVVPASGTPLNLDEFKDVEFVTSTD